MLNGNTSYQYNAESYLQSATAINGKSKTYNYDGLNNLTQVRENGVLKKNFIYESENRIAAELSSTGEVIKEYIYVTNVTTPDIVRHNGNTYRVITDHLGSVRLVVNVATGQAIQRIDYNTFGKITRDTNSCFQPYGFAGGIYDPDTNLVKFGARQYDPSIGRWTSKDPILFDGGDTNLYGYVMNDPVNFVDPEGMECTSAGKGSPIASRCGGGGSLGGGGGVGGSFNPFSGKNPQQIDKMFRDKGFEARGPDPMAGKGGYVNPQTGRSYHIDFNNRFNEPAHVDVNRVRQCDLPKRKFEAGE